MLGQSFAPLGNDEQQQQRPMGGGASPVQEAVRTLSMRVPRWTGGNTAPVPQALLHSPGMAGMQNSLSGMQQPGQMNPIMLALMQMLQGGMGGMSGGIPAPNVGVRPKPGGSAPTPTVPPSLPPLQPDVDPNQPRTPPDRELPGPRSPFDPGGLSRGPRRF